MSNNTKQHFATGKWFSIGSSGPTVDGRVIKPEWLTQAATNYDPATYTALINIEHYRPFSPKNDFSGLGKVTALKTETDAGVTKLYAQIEPTDKLIALNQGQEKIFTSMELVSNFAETQEAYLVGLAVTDSPASLRTDALQFSTNPESLLFSEFSAMSEKNQNPAPQEPAPVPAINAADSVPTEEKTGGLFANLFAKFNGNDAKVQELAENTQQGFQAAAQAMDKNQQANDQKFADLNQKIDALTEKLAGEPTPAQPQVHLHTGAAATVTHTQADY